MKLISIFDKLFFFNKLINLMNSQLNFSSQLDIFWKTFWCVGPSHCSADKPS